MKESITISQNTSWNQLETDYKKIDDGKMGRYVQLQGDKLIQCSLLTSIWQDIKQLLNFSLSENVSKSKDAKFTLLVNYCSNAKYTDLQEHIKDVRAVESAMTKNQAKTIDSLIEKGPMKLLKRHLKTSNQLQTISPNKPMYKPARFQR